MEPRLELDVLYQFNNKYAPYAGVSITSLLKNNSHFDTLNIHILDDALDPISIENREKLSQLAADFRRKIHIYDTEELTEIIKMSGIPPYRGSYSANMKMFATEILPDTIKRLIYIDSDTIVTGKLDEIVTMNMDNYCLAMVLDTVGYKHKLDIGMNENDNYYNTGVIVYNFPLWIKEHCTERISQYVKNIRAHYPAPDQDLLNLVIKEKILRIDLKYNLQPIHCAFPAKLYLKNYVPKKDYYYGYKEIVKAVKNPIIIHCFRFIGAFPWHKNSLHPNTEIWDKYLKDSYWSDYRKQKAQYSWLIKIEKLLYRVLPKVFYIKVFKLCHRLFLIRANNLSLKNKNSKNM